MKLNSASSLLPLGHAGLQRIHPFAPADQTLGYHEMIDELSAMLAEITGLTATVCNQIQVLQESLLVL